MSESEHVSLRDFIERVFDEKEKALQLAFKSQQDALALASRTLEVRLEKLNELRSEVTTDRSNYITRDKYDADRQAFSERVATLDRENRQWRDRMDGALALLRILSVGGGLALLIELGRAFGWVR